MWNSHNQITTKCLPKLLFQLLFKIWTCLTTCSTYWSWSTKIFSSATSLLALWPLTPSIHYKKLVLQLHFFPAVLKTAIIGDLIKRFLKLSQQVELLPRFTTAAIGLKLIFLLIYIYIFIYIFFLYFKWPIMAVLEPPL